MSPQQGSNSTIQPAPTTNPFIGDRVIEIECIGYSEIEIECIGDSEIVIKCIGDWVIETECIGDRVIETEGVGNRVIETECIGDRVIEIECIEERVIDTECIGYRVIDTEFIEDRQSDWNRVYLTPALSFFIGVVAALFTVHIETVDHTFENLKGVYCSIWYIRPPFSWTEPSTTVLYLASIFTYWHSFFRYNRKRNFILYSSSKFVK